MRALLIKFPTLYKVGIVRGNQESARICYATSVKLKTKITYKAFYVDTNGSTISNHTAVVDPQGEISPMNPQSVEELEQITPFPDHLEQLLRIDSQVTQEIH
ncbi:unnamed protein product [Prunus armeniaca]